MAREFQDLHQTTETMEEITAKFRESALLAPQYVTDEEMKKVRYHDMFRDDIMEFVSLSGCETLKDMIARAQEREIDLEHLGKRKPEETRFSAVHVKRPKTQHSRSRCHQDRAVMPSVRGPMREDVRIQVEDVSVVFR